MRKQPPHQTNTVLSWVGWSWLKRTKGKDCRRALSVNYSLSRRTRMFSRPPGPMSALCVMRLTMDSKSTGNPIRVGAATTLFSIFVSRPHFMSRSDLCLFLNGSNVKCLDATPFSPQVKTRSHFLLLGYSSLLGRCLRLVSYATGALPHLRLRAFHRRSSLPSLCYRIAGNSVAAL